MSILLLKNNEYHKKNTKNREKKGKRISRIIRERLQTSTKVEVCEYYELWSPFQANPFPYRSTENEKQSQCNGFYMYVFIKFVNLSKSKL